MGEPDLTPRMNADGALTWADALIFSTTGAHLNELQITILQHAWQGKRYGEIAQIYGCTEGHAKDAGSDLWKLLSTALGEKISKANYKAVAQRYQEAASIEPDTNGLSVAPSNSRFIGREEAIAHLNALEQQNHRAILIQGEGGIGKTTLAQEYLHQAGFEIVLECLMAKDAQHLTPVETVVEEWLTQEFQEEPGRNLGVTLARLKRHLQNQRVGILIDNLEPALDRNGVFIADCRDYSELLRILTSPRNLSLTLLTSRDRLCESSLSVEHYRLAGLSITDWQGYFALQNIPVESELLSKIHTIYGGNAKAMQLIAGQIRTDFDGDMALYWQWAATDPLQMTALKNLVASQMNRLQLLDQEAYQLLCRLSCYRLQERPYLSKQALVALLWDTEPSRQGQVIQSLCNRSLIEFQGGSYWLHPVIRAEAIARLKEGNEWELTHQKAAAYWSEAIRSIHSIDEALDAWEAYYHWIEIENYEAASLVILQSHHNQWQQYLPLGSILYRMGLTKQVLNAIESVIDYVQDDSRRSELNNIWGDLNWITGNIHAAIAQQKTSLQTASDCLLQLKPDQFEEGSGYRHRQYYLQMLKIDSLLSLGLYSLDLWELEDAAQYLEQVIELGNNSDHSRWAEKATIALALVRCHQGQTEYAQSLIITIDQKIQESSSPVYAERFAYFIQIMGQVYVALHQYSKAQTLFERAIAYAIEGHYAQIQGLALNGMAMIYRQQDDFEKAIALHQEAVQLLEKIGASCDLAHVYSQWSQTLKEMGRLSQKHHQHAIDLFEKIPAPQQIKRLGSS